MVRTLFYLAIASTVAVAATSCSNMDRSMIGSSDAPPTPLQRQSALLARAGAVLREQEASPGTPRIPARLIADARCIAVFPTIIQAGLIFGGSRGQGVVTCRRAAGDFASAAPAIYTLTDASFGLQVGGQHKSVVILFTTDSSVDALVDSKLTLGSQLAAVAGPTGVNRPIKPGPAPVVAYVTSKTGLFAGVSVVGNKLAFDPVANLSLYGTTQTPAGVLRGSARPPAAADRFLRTLRRFASTANTGYTRR